MQTGSSKESRKETDRASEMAVLDSLVTAKDQNEMARMLSGVIQATTHFDVLDKAALIAEEYKVGGALGAMFERIQDPYTHNHRETILFGCSQFDCSFYFDIIVNIVIDDTFGAAVEALHLIRDNTPNIDRMQLASVLERTKLLLGNAGDITEDRTEILEELATQMEERLGGSEM